MQRLALRPNFAGHVENRKENESLSPNSNNGKAIPLSLRYLSVGFLSGVVGIRFFESSPSSYGRQSSSLHPFVR